MPDDPITPKVDAPERSPSQQRLLDLRRKVTDRLATGFAVLMAVLVIAPLLAVFTYLVLRGVGSLNLAFFTHLPVPVGEQGGGVANAIVGSVMILGIASIIGVPWGIGAGIYLAEYGRGSFATAAALHRRRAERRAFHRDRHRGLCAGGADAEALLGALRRRGAGHHDDPHHHPRHRGSAAAGATHGAGSSLGLGVARWRATLSVTLRTASAGVITAVMLAFARIAGETAPLLFTAFGNQFWNLNPNQPTAALPLQLFVYAISPFDEWHRLAWAGALVLIALIVGAVAAVRMVASRGMFQGAN